MRVFLCDFSSIEYIEVAARLAAEGAEILYWTGFKQAFFDISKNTNNYPNTIFHNISDAIRGISAKGLDMGVPPDAALISDMLECEALALPMMNRMDFNNMPLSEKQHLYYKYLGYWDHVLKKLKPEVIIFSEIPHVVYNFVLYSLAKKYDIPTIMLASSHLYGWHGLVKDYKKSDENLLTEYKKIENETHSTDELDPILRDYYFQLQSASPKVTPIYNQVQQPRAKRNSLIMPTLGAIIRNIRAGKFLEVSQGHFRSLFKIKKQVLSVDAEDNTQHSHLWHLQKIKKIKKGLRNEYLKLQSPADLNKDYIYFPLSFQPERTTSPMADFYTDLILIAKTLSASVPSGWLIYIKEYPLQWSSYNYRSHFARYRGYYKELAALPNVRLIPTDSSSYKLVVRAKAVATSTGSTGWEALVYGKPVLIFGHPWYKYCDGLFLVDGVEKCKAVIQEIIGGAKPNAQKVLNYFLAFQKTAIRTDQLAKYQLGKCIDTEQSIKNITGAILEELKQI